MKKVLAAILSLFYLAAVSGIGMNMHYCCGTLAKVEIGFADAFGSAVSIIQPAHQDGNCCKDVHKQFKITQPQYAPSDVTIHPGHSFAVLLPYVSDIPSLFFSSIAKGSFSPHSPPFRETSAYLRNCSFLI